MAVDVQMTTEDMQERIHALEGNVRALAMVCSRLINGRPLDTGDAKVVQALVNDHVAEKHRRAQR